MDQSNICLVEGNFEWFVQYMDPDHVFDHNILDYKNYDLGYKNYDLVHKNCGLDYKNCGLDYRN